MRAEQKKQKLDQQSGCDKSSTMDQFMTMYMIMHRERLAAEEERMQREEERACREAEREEERASKGAEQQHHRDIQFMTMLSAIVNACPGGSG